MEIITFIILIFSLLYIRYLIKTERKINKMNILFYNTYYFKQYNEINLNWRLIAQETMNLTKTMVKDNFFNMIIDSNMLLQNYYNCPITMKFLINIPNIIYAGFIFIDPYTSIALESKHNTYNYIIGLNASYQDKNNNTYLKSKKHKFILENGKDLVHNSNYNLLICNNSNYDSVLLLIRFKRGYY